MLSAPLLAPGLYDLCFSVDGGATPWLAQLGMVLGVVATTPNDVSAVVPTVIGLGATTTVTLDLAVDNGTESMFVAWSRDLSCIMLGALESVVAVPVGAVGAVDIALAAPLSTAGDYATCFTRSGPDDGWVAQAGPSTVLTVVEATPTSITSILPPLVATSVAPTVVLTGVVPTPSTRIAFAVVRGMWLAWDVTWDVTWNVTSGGICFKLTMCFP